MTDGGRLAMMAETFGYRAERLRDVEGLQVAEGKDPESLMPIVALWIRLDTNERCGYAMTPDMADGAANELRRWAARAREKHFEEPPARYIDVGVAIAMLTECVAGQRPAVDVVREYAVTHGAEEIACLLLTLIVGTLLGVVPNDDDAMELIRYYATVLHRIGEPPEGGGGTV